MIVMSGVMIVSLESEQSSELKYVVHVSVATDTLKPTASAIAAHNTHSTRGSTHRKERVSERDEREVVGGSRHEARAHVCAREVLRACVCASVLAT
jgi:hypothetical protein